ncbi:hypothetical protein [Shewanella indica]|uniref:hypothetical protein n=1 Tax=Shewanella indica TaxID=768528 RepID=UPI001CFCAFF2|nr:hypothetical protein [Shewanella indica]
MADDKEPGVGESPAVKNDSHHKSRRAFSKLATELTDEELHSPGVQKMLLAEISRLESALNHCDGFREKYHEVEKNCAVLKEKEKTFIFSEILYSTSLTLGAALVGISPSIKESDVSPMVVGGVGALMVIGAIVAKVFRR